MQPPKAIQKPQKLVIHNDERIDPYLWLNQRDAPEVLEYLEQENAYTEFILKDTEDFQKELFEEMKARYKEDDASLPYFFNEYWYIVKFEKGKDYPLFFRKYQTLEEEEELLLDANQLAEGKKFLDVGSMAVSPNNKLATYSTDETGRRIYSIFIKNLETGGVSNEVIENTTGKVVWANDNEHFFYIRKDKSLRAYQIFRHKLGTSPSEDVLVFHEKDTSFDVNLFKTKSLEYIFIASSSTVSDEHRFIPADDVSAPWQIVQTREEGLEYAVEHYQNHFYIITNEGGATNFKLVKTPVATPQKENWQTIIPHREDTLLEGFEIFKDYLVVEERREGLLQISIRHWETNEQYYLPFQEETYTAYIGLNLDFNSTKLRYGYSSLVQPSATFEFDMNSQTQILLKEQEVLGGKFSKENYTSERLWASSRDGVTQIPISLVYRKDTVLSQDTPLLLYGYGSYGHTIDASFSRGRLSLLDRGFVFAIAHIRGGEYLGREWYEKGKLLHKKNTFYDFIDCAKFLIEKNYTSSKHLYAIGGSAGGLLVGAVINEEPSLFNGAVAQVPFVDVVTTMLDEEIPLTTGEFDEWGNPKEEQYYHYMKSYSPYDNIKEQSYPHLLVTTGYHDSQVQYWEPAKWVAKLRDMKKDQNFLVFKTDFSSGHGGASGRFESLKEDALEYAFLMKLEKLSK
ncbi:S9 family peptidase [Riemerella anatipestifer]|uniref:Proline-specific endopeptidase n=1 Tax=Riemerella anatipestifer (strain ATCC 11845 / DSM 15868 / JCM 9532 / NCTC 11014) TaxID=693978 RepID=E4TAL0_RIEAD|nr:oligopeptidase B [Riemerella anatipestifer]ADQ82370.1 Oligopeptidase B [Riemerella anatipestifer ATCC 11845 = DSM 15868]AFD56372.1 oligopeptidase b [Riemerella anatipestifer ATCC 11845 = DSM 15868]MRM92807.1 oligopeptidase B [Riemerella anatipestifer]MSN89436.1 oligopeptidase B [Riemerella anatipestifer]SNV62695.1 Protease 2 [Riemerella anatipestifer]